MQNRIIELDTKNKDLKEKLKIKREIFFENNAYWLKKEGGSKEGPFCSGCWDKNKEVIRMIQLREGMDMWVCPVCKNAISTGMYSKRGK